ncbi:YihY/virulence factor BrkB family protein [Polaribacter dokdonensis]|uniref:Membrane protein n=1 Tax=Polaribacter dokdonensis DSW-5 TaxID=1300348 RepID=A0A0M9CHN8_9FLAO|nr:YihY/virulence factor BrkB family protein [Polaribacter dokdonensis]KOY52349.1 Ribonuclease BN-like family protein [Polaribacter dokdonensis DSW-5]SEE43858.1 membrane protein [Polaribacter dokdonensis DSW-5]
MSKSKEDRFDKIPVVNSLVKLGKKIKVPGLEGMSLFDVIEMYVIGIVEGALTTRASGIAYSFFMAIFPFLLFILTLIPYVPIDGAQEGLLSIISDVLPPKTFDAVDTVIIDIINNQYGGLLSFGFIGSIFLMTNGVNAIFGGFEFSYHVKEIRNIFRAYFIAMFVSFVIVAFLLITVVIIIFFELLLKDYVTLAWLEDNLIWIQLVRGSIFLAMIFITVSMLYHYGVKEGKYSRFFSPGAVFTTVLSVLSFYLFGFYVNEFAKYNELYGSIGTLLILMLFIWLNAIILLLGFELNASIYSLRVRNKSKATNENL